MSKAHYNHRCRFLEGITGLAPHRAMILITNKLRCCCFKNFTGDHCPELHHLHCFFWPLWTTIEEINPTIFFPMSSKVKLTSFFYRNNITGDHCVQNDHLLMWKILSTTTLSSSFSLDSVVCR